MVIRVVESAVVMVDETRACYTEWRKSEREKQKLYINAYIYGEGNGTPLQYSCLENPMDGGAWKAAVHEVAEGQTWLSNLTFTFHFHALEKEMATHSSVLAWRIPGTGEPGGLLFMGSHRVRHDWSDLAVLLTLKKLTTLGDITLCQQLLKSIYRTNS